MHALLISFCLAATPLPIDAPVREKPAVSQRVHFAQRQSTATKLKVTGFLTLGLSVPVAILLGAGGVVCWTCSEGGRGGFFGAAVVSLVLGAVGLVVGLVGVGVQSFLDDDRDRALERLDWNPGTRPPSARLLPAAEQLE